MPDFGTAKTKSAPKQPPRKRPYVAALLVVIALTALFLPTLLFRPATSSVRLGGQTFTLDIAASEAARTKGLSGRSTLPSGRGLLFVFEQASSACMWMKNMRFSIDIVWLDRQKRVVHTEQRVSPATYPAAFCSPRPARYVLELPQGSVETTGLKVGQTLVL